MLLAGCENNFNKLSNWGTAFIKPDEFVLIIWQLLWHMTKTHAGEKLANFTTHIDTKPTGSMSFSQLFHCDR